MFRVFCSSVLCQMYQVLQKVSIRNQSLLTIQQVWSSSDGVQQGGAFGIVQVSENLNVNCVYQFDLNNPSNQSNCWKHWRMESYLLYRENSWLNGVHIHVGSQVYHFSYPCWKSGITLCFFHRTTKRLPNSFGKSILPFCFKGSTSGEVR